MDKHDYELEREGGSAYGKLANQRRRQISEINRAVG
jgi:hypothetical protein